jgi:hypothetical protein
MFTLPKIREIFSSEEETRKDILQVVISDTHSGSNYALFLNRHWQGLKGNNHTPTSKQMRIRAQWERFAEEVRQARQGKKVVLVHNGDAIDGDHHASGDVCTLNPKEHADIHIELMNELQRLIEWQRGDELYYTRGTQTHVNEYEYYIGEQLNAVPDGEFYCWDMLPLLSNGVLSWFVHHGPRAGEGANEGNTMRNWLKTIYFDALKDGKRIPGILYTGHVHQPTYSTYVYRERMEFHTMHGVILPSWQLKTYYAWEKAPVSKNKIGGVVHEIKADGTVTIPRFSVMESN